MDWRIEHRGEHQVVVFADGVRPATVVEVEACQELDRLRAEVADAKALEGRQTILLGKEMVRSVTAENRAKKAEAEVERLHDWIGANAEQRDEFEGRLLVRAKKAEARAKRMQAVVEAAKRWARMDGGWHGAPCPCDTCQALREAVEAL